MVQTVKSVLLVDYDSLYRSLNEAQPGTGELLGARAGVWLEAIESGDIVEAPGLDSDIRRRFQTKRCYADPKLLGKNRGWLTANGVQVVDCTPAGGLGRGPSDINLTLDALDAAESEPDEIIILSAETDLTPLLFRLRALNQKVVIYVTAETAGSYRTFADGTIDGAFLAGVLSQPTEAPVSATKGAIPRPPRISVPPKDKQQRTANGSGRAGAGSAKAGTATPPIDREALASLVRRIHEATNVPLFSPRAFAELFRLIAEDVAANGYKFSATTDRVTEGMNALGRNVSKRQVGFVVKGLALRGHVFTRDDRPSELASVFYEQVLYLVETTDLALSDVETGLVRAWLGGSEAPPPQARPEAQGSKTARPANSSAPEPRPRQTPPPREQRSDRPPPVEPKPEPRADDAFVLDMEERRERVDTIRVDRDPPPLRTTSRPKRVVEDAPQPEPTVDASFARRVGRNGAAATPPRARPPAADADIPRDDELEDSIMSAIADAVDVLAVDTPVASPVPGTRSSMSARRSASIAPDVEPPTSPDESDQDADEIGDEIQRILASYSDTR